MSVFDQINTLIAGIALGSEDGKDHKLNKRDDEQASATAAVNGGVQVAPRVASGKTITLVTCTLVNV